MDCMDFYSTSVQYIANTPRMSAVCMFCTMDGKTPEPGRLQLAGEEIGHVQQSQHFLICCANENMYIDKQFCVDESHCERER